MNVPTFGAIRTGGGMQGLTLMVERSAVRSSDPLDPLDEDEIRTTVGIVRRHPRYRESHRFFSVTLLEPEKGVGARYRIEMAEKPGEN